MDHDPLDVIAQSYRSLAETQHYIAQTQRQREALEPEPEALLGLSLLGAGVLFWQHGGQTQALRAETQTLTAQTEALLEVLRQRQIP